MVGELLPVEFLGGGVNVGDIVMREAEVLAIESDSGRSVIQPASPSQRQRD